MFLKIYFNIFVILHLTLLISFISADNNDEFNLRKHLTHDLKDTNSDLKWWEYFLSSETKENKNIVPLKTAESSIAFDVVQTHLSDEEIPDEELPATTRAPFIKTSRTTTQRTVEISQQPRKTIQVAKTTTTRRPNLITQPAIKSVPKSVVIETTKSSLSIESDDEELDSNKILIKPTPRKPIPQPTKSKPSSGTKGGGVKARQPISQPRPVTSSRPIITTTTRSSITTGSEEEDEEEEPLPTIKSVPASQPRKVPAPQPRRIVPTTTNRPATIGKRPSQPAPKPIGTKTRQPTKSPIGTKSKQLQSKPSPRPTVITSRPIITTTARSTTAELEDDDEEEIKSSPSPQPRKVSVPQPKKTQPTKKPIAGVKTKQSTTKKTQIQTTTKPSLVEEDDETENKTTNKPIIQPLPRKVPAPSPRPPSRPQPQQPVIVKGGIKGGAKTRPISKPSTSTIKDEESDDSDDSDNDSVDTTKAPSRPISPIQKMTGVKRPIQTGTKTKQLPTKPSLRPIVTTTLRPTIAPTTTLKSTTEEDSEEETLAPVTQPRKTVQVTTSRPILGGGVKRPLQPGTKTIQLPAKPTIKVEPKKVTTTAKPNLDDDSGVGEPFPKRIPSGRSTTSAPRKQRPQIQTTTRRPVIVEEDEEEENEITLPRKPVPAPAPRTKIGTKLPNKPNRPQIGTKTKQLPTKISPRKVTTKPSIISTTTSRSVSEEDDSEDETISPARVSSTIRPQIPTTTKKTAISEEDEEDEELKSLSRKPAPAPAPRPQRPQTTTKRPEIVEEDEEEENEITAPRKPVPQPLPKGRIGTKTPIRPSGTKTLPTPSKQIPTGTKGGVKTKQTSTSRPSPRLAATTSRSTTIEEDTEEETETPAPRLSPRPTQTTTSKPAITEDDEEDETLPTSKPVPRPQRPQIQTTTRRPATVEEDEEEENEITAPRKPVPSPIPRGKIDVKTPIRPIGTKTPVKPIGTKTRPQQPVVIKSTTTIEADTEEETEAPRISRPVPAPQPRKIIPTASTASSLSEDEDDEDTPTTRRPIPSPLPRSKIIGTKTKIGTKNESTQPSFKPRITTTTSAPASTEEDNDSDEELPSSTSRPIQPRVTTQGPRGIKVPTGTKTKITSQPRLSTTSAPQEENIIEEEKNDLPSRPESTEAPTVVVTTPKRVVSKTRTENVPVPRPVSFSRKRLSKTSPPKEETPSEATTLEPIPVPAFEPTRRSSKPIIQSVSVDNEEDESELPLKKESVKNAERIHSSDLAKFSSRVRFAERPSNLQIRSLFSYSPPLPNSESFEINRIK